MLTPIADGNITTGQVVTQCIFAATFPGGTAGVAIRSALEAFVMADLCRRQAGERRLRFLFADWGVVLHIRVPAPQLIARRPP